MTALKTLCFLGCLLAAFTFSGCANFAAWLRQYTYPPSFNYITAEQLRSTMWQLARDMRELETALREPAEFDEQRRAQIAGLLASIDENTGKLNPRAQPSNHWMIDANLPAFRHDVALARREVERNPPNYKLAGFLPGACVYCHGRR